MFSKSLTKHFMGPGTGFTELQAKLDAGMLLIFAISRSRNKPWRRKTIRAKTMFVQSAVSLGRLTQQACRSVTVASPLIFFHRGSYNNNSPGTFRYYLVHLNDSEISEHL
jgi:hypothetical protein